MQVVSGPFGREKVHFEAPDAARLGDEMAAFIGWFNAPLTVDPVIQSGLAHFRFVTIHPFEDGNGRMARALADMALARADGRPERFYSMSAQIEAERQTYYEVLESSQKGGVSAIESRMLESTRAVGVSVSPTCCQSVGNENAKNAHPHTRGARIHLPGIHLETGARSWYVSRFQSVQRHARMSRQGTMLNGR